MCSSKARGRCVLCVGATLPASRSFGLPRALTRQLRACARPLATLRAHVCAPPQALDEAGEAGMSVIIKEAMANGRVLQSGPLRETAAALGVPPDALAMGAAMALGCAPVVLSGAATRAHARSNAQAPQAMEALQRCAPDALERLLVECKEDSARYWKDRAVLEWN